MRVLVVDNAHLYKDNDGLYYSPSIYSYKFLSRYLKVFDEVRFLSKVKYVDEVNKEKCNLVSGKGVEILELPWYQGMLQMSRCFKKLFAIYRKAGQGCDCYIFRVAQLESFLTYLLKKDRKKPFAVEVVNDPEMFVDMPKLARFICIKLLKKMVIKAQGASYVTEFYLQKKYPNKKNNLKKTYSHFETFYSSVDLEEEDFDFTPQVYDKNKIFRIIHISNAINSDIKGHKTLINATKYVINKGYNIETWCIGEGSKIQEFTEYAKKLGVSKNINFIGRISSKQLLLKTMKECNLLVLPTKMEGLPRTIIEAMAVGLPCISTPIAGIPELLANKYLFAPNDYKGFAMEIIRLMNSPKELYDMGLANIEKAKQYSAIILEKRRTEFYTELKNVVINGK